MQGYQLVFSRHGSVTVGEWLLMQAKELGAPGATMNASQSSYGVDGKFHSAHFFELAEQPIEVLMVVTEKESERLFALIDEASLEIFYSKAPVEFGVTGKKG